MALVRVEMEGGIGKVYLNNPDKLNILSRAMLKELYNTFTELKKNEEVRVIILTGEGRAFAAGADIKEMSQMGPEEALEFSKLGQEVFDYIENLEKPVIAAINGYALGGGLELAMSCDIRLASNKAKLGQPEVKLGLIPGFAGTQRLIRLAGLGNAKYLVLTGIQIDAETARYMGIVQEVVEHDKLMDRAMELARMILDSGPFAVKVAKRVINVGKDASFPSAISHERDSFALLFSGEEAKEGLSAFLEKRKPKWVQG